jgi:enoyl-CoA hydratase/carnithine racemase
MALAEAKTEGFVGTICLDHIEKRNSLSGALSDEIIKALDNFNEPVYRGE